MSPSYVIPLEEAPDEPAVVGGKGAGLARLLRAGLPVPPGFVITAPALRGAGQRWPEELRAAVVQAYESLCARAGTEAVAVRSSAIAEDSADASFAGQHLTNLNVLGSDAVLEGVRACWASLLSDGARQYRRALGVVDEDDAAMAVVVQALVPAEASGVVFTLDPVSGDRDVVVVEAAWGLGEGVVGGAVTPDHYAVRKAGGAVVRREVAEKTVRVVPKAGGGIVEEAIAGARTAPVLTDEQLAELVSLAARIEDISGTPQDIEWALAGGRFYVLQSRPVTAAGPAAEEWVSEFDTETSPDTIWTAANVQEVFPGQVSPLTVTMTLEMVERFGLEPVERVGIRLKTKEPFSAYFYGRPFLNVSMMLEVADQMPFGSAEPLMDQFFGRARNPDVKPKRPSLRKLLSYARIFPRLIWFGVRMPARIREAEKTVEAFDREMREQPFEALSDEELLYSIEDGLERGGEVAVTHVSGGGLTSSSFEWLRVLTERWLGDETGALQATLCTGLASVESAQPAYELWDLSRIVLESPRLAAAFTPHNGAEIDRRLAALPEEETAGFRRRLDEFLAGHGHRSVMEAESAARSWSEDLPTVYAMIRNYLHARDDADPQRIEERQRREREQVTAECLQRLGWWRRLVFRFVLRDAHRGVSTREHTKWVFIRAVDRGRKATRALAHRLVQRGLLNEIWDLYYLSWEEAKALLRRQLDREAAYASIRRRRAEEERNRSVILPETFQGRPKPLRLSDMPLPDGHTLRGIPVSPGRVTGPARVIMDPRVDASIEPGEILVAPVTDAGWTPLFIAAAGIVVDIGGTLSHGSTVAREYGLPAVVNVKHGTRMIRTGQRITVDGAQGVVVLEDEEQGNPSASSGQAGNREQGTGLDGE